jgi:hypothetical protein
MKENVNYAKGFYNFQKASPKNVSKHIILLLYEIMSNINS